MEADSEKKLIEILGKIEKSLAASSRTAPTGPRGGGRDRSPAATEKNVMRATAKKHGDLSSATDEVSSKFRHLNKVLIGTIGNFSTLNRSMRGRPAGAPAQGVNPQTASPVGSYQTAQLSQSSNMLMTSAKKFGKGAILFLAGVDLATSAFETLRQIGADFYKLAAGGVVPKTADEMFSLYKSVVLSGQTLEDYTKMLKENEIISSRFSSFTELDKTIDSTKDQLSSLGVFGPIARQLGATMASTAVSMGISKEQLASTMNAQVGLFDELRKTTLMTADEFGNLIKSTANNTAVQDELVGLSKEQRAARFQELLSINAIGSKMGLAADEAKALGDALLSQRKATAIQRFREAGVIRQAGALTGLSTDDTDRLSQLKRKKVLSPEEAKEFVDLGAKLRAGLSQLQSSGQIGIENIADSLESNLGQTFSQIEAAGKAAMAQESGPAGVNTQMGKYVGEFGQYVGNLGAILNGLAKSPIGTLGSSIISAVSAGFAAAFGGQIFTGIIAGAKGASTAISGVVSSAGNMVKGIPSLLGNAVKSIGTGAATIFSKVTGLFSGAGGFFSSVAGVFKGGAGNLLTAAKTGFTGMFAGLGSFMGSIIKGGAWLGAIFGAVEELFTGEMGAAFGLGDGFVGRLGGMLIAGFRGILGGLADLIDPMINWALEKVGLNFKNPLGKFVDTITIGLVSGFKMIGGSFAAVVADVVGIFSKDNAVYKGLRGFSDSMIQSVSEDGEKLRKIWLEDKSLKDQGAEAIKKKEDMAKRAEVAAKRLDVANGSTVMGIENLAASARMTVDAARANAIAAGPSPDKSITPPEVNKMKEEAEKKAAEKISSGPTMVKDPEVIAVLTQQLELTKQMLYKLDPTLEKKAISYTPSSLPDISQLTPFSVGA